MAALSPTGTTLLPNGLSVPERLLFLELPLAFWNVVLVPGLHAFAATAQAFQWATVLRTRADRKVQETFKVAQRTESLRKTQPHVGVCFSFDLLFGVANAAPPAASHWGRRPAGAAPQRACPGSPRSRTPAPAGVGRASGRLGFPHRAEAAGRGCRATVTCQASLRKQEAARMLGPGAEDR